MKVRISRRARHHLDDIWLHIAELSQSGGAATRVLLGIDDAFKLLGRNPAMGRPRDSDLGTGFRSFVVGQHVVVYQVGKNVVISGVFHHTQDLSSLFQ